MTALASKGQLRMSFLRYALVTVPVILFLGFLSGKISNSGYGNPWFDALQKPAQMPPGLVFPIVWSALYILLGLALATILNAHGADGRGKAITLFVAQLILNLSWSPLFFAYHKVQTALMVIAAMFVLAAATAYLFARIRKIAGILLIPYLAWLLFASWLNFQILVLNPGAETLVPAGASAHIDF